MTPSTAISRIVEPDLALRVERVAALPDSEIESGYAVGRVIDPGLEWTGYSRVLLPWPAGPVSEVLVPVEQVFPLPAGMKDVDALLVPALSKVLEIWDRLELEIGETAVVTENGLASRLSAVVARWYGPAQVVYLGDRNGDFPPGTVNVETSDPVAALKELRGILDGVPAVAVAELSGQVEKVDLVLEAVPPFSRVMLAGPRRDLLVIDFYTNVHRKGLRLLSGALELQSTFDHRADNRAGTNTMMRAVSLLLDGERADECHAAL